MNCEDFEQRLPDLLDRRLAAQEEAAARMHLASCPRCHGELRDLEELLAVTRALPEEPPPAGFADLVMNSVAAQDEAKRRRSRFRLISIGAVGSLAAGFLLLVLVQPSIEQAKSLQPAPARSVEAFDKIAKNQELLDEESLGAQPFGLTSSTTSSYVFSATAEKQESELAFLSSLASSSDADEGKGKENERKKVSEKDPAKESQSKTVAGAIAEPEGKFESKPEQARVLRLHLPRSRLIAMREQWEKISGIKIEEVSLADSKRRLVQGKRDGAKPPSSPALEEIVEVVIYLQPIAPPKPR